jgi:hypothetical protein
VPWKFEWVISNSFLVINICVLVWLANCPEYTSLHCMYNYWKTNQVFFDIIHSSLFSALLLWCVINFNSIPMFFTFFKFLSTNTYLQESTTCSLDLTNAQISLIFYTHKVLTLLNVPWKFEWVISNSFLDINICVLVWLANCPEYTSLPCMYNYWKTNQVFFDIIHSSLFSALLLWCVINFNSIALFFTFFKFLSTNTYLQESTTCSLDLTNAQISLIFYTRKVLTLLNVPWKFEWVISNSFLVINICVLVWLANCPE